VNGSENGRCRERYQTEVCCIALGVPHDVHVAINPNGEVTARWRMVAEGLPVEDAVPHQINPKYL
jgi:hypothetical protein